MGVNKAVYLLCAIVIRVTGAVQPGLTSQISTDLYKKGMMGEEVVLKCFFMTSKPWYLIQWKRITENGEAVTIVTLQSSNIDTTLTPLWSDNEMDNRGTSARKNDSGVVFNLRINSFGCDDVGIYECIVTDDNRHIGITNLTIQALPHSPRVHPDILIVDPDYNFTLECLAEVGIPPRTIRWYRKYPNERNFQLVLDNMEMDSLKSNSCIPYMKRQLISSITEGTSGTTYRCEVEGAKNMDEIEIRTPVKIVTEAPYETACSGSECESNVVRDAENQENNASVTLFSVLLQMTVTTICLVLLS